jgi:ankyrin repeat protein
MPVPFRVLLAATVIWSGPAMAAALEPLSGLDYGASPAVVPAAAETAPQSLRLPRQSGRYALHRAALYDNVKALAGLVGRGMPVDERDDEGRTALMVAAAFGNVAAAEELIMLGADPRVRDVEGETALHFAARAGKADIVDLLIDYGVDPDLRTSPREATALHYAATFGHEKIVRLLIARGADANAADIEAITPLQYASRRNRYALVDVLVSLGARQQSLHDAVNANDVGRVVQLIREGADVDAPDLDGPPINLAAAKGLLGVVRILVDAGADIEAVGDPANSHPLHIAAMYGQPETAAFLIARGAKVDSRDDWGRTPLMVAATFGTSDMAELLLLAGADPISRDSYWQGTALHCAAMSGHVGIVRMLIDAGVPVDLRSGHDGETALHFASGQTSRDLVVYLLAQGADINSRDDTGATPLKYALDHPSKSGSNIVLLRERGAVQ